MNNYWEKWKQIFRKTVNLCSWQQLPFGRCILCKWIELTIFHLNGNTFISVQIKLSMYKNNSDDFFKPSVSRGPPCMHENGSPNHIALLGNLGRLLDLLTNSIQWLTSSENNHKCMVHCKRINYTYRKFFTDNIMSRMSDLN